MAPVIVTNADTLAEGSASYVAVVGTALGRHWLVKFSLSGVLETAFVIENAEHYLSQADFDLVGTVSEVLG